MHAIQSFAKALYFIWEDAPMNEFNNDLLNATGEIPYGLIHIGFINFTLVPGEPEFCSTHMMCNIKTHKIYTSKLRGLYDVRTAL